MTQPRAIILSGHGLNCERETAFALQQAGATTEIHHINDLANNAAALSDAQILAVPGGFSFGDHLGAGKALANRLADQLSDRFARFMEREDHLAIGICNGCQMLSQLRELIPQAEHWPSFVRNRSEQFEGRVVMVCIEDNASPWLNDMAGSVIPVAIAHGEGRAE